MLPELHTAIPGPRSQQLADRLRRCESRNVTYLGDDFPIFWERAEGATVWDVDGNRFIDFTSAFGVAGLGHSNPSVIAALNEQSQSLLHGMGDVHPTELKVRVCEQLSEITFQRWGVGTGRVILGNAGFEAVEAALKTAQLATGRAGVISFENAYHGLGYGTLSAGAMPRFREPFAEQLAAFGRSLPFPHCDCREEWADDGDCSADCEQRLAGVEMRIERAFAESPIPIGAILVEPVLGRGGKVTPPREFLPMLRRSCDRHGALLIVDEILTGLNRCGALFACDLSDTVPDIICLGKALSSGLPLSACIGSEAAMEAWPESDGEAIHTTTHLGNPLACAMALASLEQLRQPDLAASVAVSGRKLANRFRAIADHSHRLKTVRGAGLLRGLEVVDPENGAPDGKRGGGFVPYALKKGFVVLAESPEGNIVSLAPAFDISDTQIDALAEVFQEYLMSLPGSIS